MAGLPEEDLNVVERQAFNLAQAGIQLDQARLGGDDNGTLAQALEHNLQVWVEIGILARRQLLASAGYATRRGRRGEGARRRRQNRGRFVE